MPVEKSQSKSMALWVATSKITEACPFPLLHLSAISLSPEVTSVLGSYCSFSLKSALSLVLVAYTYNLKLLRRQRSGGSQFKASPDK
jgi:hypothetical protein